MRMSLGESPRIKQVSRGLLRKPRSAVDEGRLIMGNIPVKMILVITGFYVITGLCKARAMRQRGLLNQGVIEKLIECRGVTSLNNVKFARTCACSRNLPKTLFVNRSRINMSAKIEDLVVSPTGIRLVPINLSRPDSFNEYNLYQMRLHPLNTSRRTSTSMARKAISQNFLHLIADRPQEQLAISQTFEHI